MNTVDRVKAVCHERKIPISRLEKDLGYANGYIGQLKKGTLPDNRLRAIADYLDVSTEYLSTGNEASAADDNSSYIDPKTVKMAKELSKNEQLYRLFDVAAGADPADITIVCELLVGLKSRTQEK